PSRSWAPAASGDRSTAASSSAWVGAIPITYHSVRSGGNVVAKFAVDLHTGEKRHRPRVGAE
ncbi:MAG: hypothetical protein M3O32_12595, partial [Actinomycetota bacterium]|nr:hypothetical protein [Actinomycetota bacterium]